MSHALKLITYTCVVRENTQTISKVGTTWPHAINAATNKAWHAVQMHTFIGITVAAQMAATLILRESHKSTRL